VNPSNTDSENSTKNILPMRAIAPTEELGFDPLEQLLNEFSDIEDLTDLDDEELDDYRLESTENTLTTDFSALSNTEVISQVTQDLSRLSELRQRLNYYLDEIELFLPNKAR
jgi:hypothetical protein